MAVNEELLGLHCLEARCQILCPTFACQTLSPMQGIMFYDIAGERYIEEDEEKIVLMPQARERELVYQLLACLPHLALL